MVYRTRITFNEVDYGRILFHGHVHTIAAKAIEELYLRAGIRIPQLIRERKIGIPVTESRCVFVSPIVYLDEVEVRAGAVDLTPKGYRMLYNLLVLPEERLAVAGHLRHRFVDTRRFKGTELPHDLMEAFSRLQPEVPLVDDQRDYAPFER